MSSPQSRGARQRSAMAKQQERGLILRPNFLLTCSDDTLASHELALLAECADIRSQLQELLDRWNDTTAQVAVVKWFRRTDRQALKHAIENEETPIEWANRMIREGQRSEEERELLPLPSLEPGAAHLATALRYAERNIAAGRCGVCPKPLDRNSVRYCTRHLEIARLRKPPKGAIGDPPGSIGYLYGDGIFRSSHNKAPSQVKALKEANEKRAQNVKKDREQ